MPSSATGNEEEERADRGRRGTPLLASVIATAVLVGLAWWRRPDVEQLVRVLPADDAAVALDREVNADFGMRNPVVWVVAAREGTVWTPTLLHHVQGVTREVLAVPGVIATDVLSLASPNVRDVQVTEDMLGPVYLMGEVPETSEAIAAVRQRVQGNANYRGVFVSTDERAAMVVANFRDDADASVVAAAALAIRDRHRDANTQVYVSGEPIMPASIRPAMPHIAAIAGTILALAALVLAVLDGWRALLAVGLTMSLTALWGITALMILHALLLPWVLPALLAVLPVAASFISPARRGRHRGGDGFHAACGHKISDYTRTLYPTAAMVAGFCVMAWLSESPLRAFGIAGAVLAIAGGLAARVTGRLVPLAATSVPRRSAPVPAIAAAASLLIAAGAWRLHSSFGLFGYGERYLPASAVADLRGVARHFPPPTALVVRARGTPGFLASAAVMDAFDGVTAAASRDPAVVRALSLADLVKMVHRTFNDNQPDYFVVPRESALISRYLALSYAPQFRTFVDRAFSQAAIWVYLSSASVRDLTRVGGLMNAQLAAHPIPNAQVDRFGGDGALVMTMARLARGLVLAALAGLLVMAVVLAVFRGPTVGLWTLLAGLAGGSVAAGGLGWLGCAVDLLSLPCIVAAGAAAAALTAVRMIEPASLISPFLVVLTVMSTALLFVSGGAADVFGACLLAVALVPIASGYARGTWFSDLAR